MWNQWTPRPQFIKSYQALVDRSLWYQGMEWRLVTITSTLWTFSLQYTGYLFAYVKCALFSVSVPVCVTIISLFGIFFSDNLQCKINICCYIIFTVERWQQKYWKSYTSESSQYTIIYSLWVKIYSSDRWISIIYCTHVDY